VRSIVVSFSYFGCLHIVWAITCRRKARPRPLGRDRAPGPPPLVFGPPWGLRLTRVLAAQAGAVLAVVLRDPGVSTWLALAPFGAALHQAVAACRGPLAAEEREREAPEEGVQ